MCQHLDNVFAKCLLIQKECKYRFQWRFAECPDYSGWEKPPINVTGEADDEFDPIKEICESGPDGVDLIDDYLREQEELNPQRLVVCPVCGGGINYLIAAAPAYWKFSIKDNKPDYELIDALPGSGDITYQCPECKEEIFDDEKETIELLEGEWGIWEPPQPIS